LVNGLVDLTVESGIAEIRFNRPGRLNALDSDLAVAADDAKFTFSYTKVAVNPDCGGTYALVRLVGLRKAMEIALLADTLDAEEVLKWGLVNKVVPAAELREATFTMARRLADGPGLALASTKALLRRSCVGSLRTQLEAELECFVHLSGGADFDEGLNSFFSKRRPVFT